MSGLLFAPGEPLISRLGNPVALAVTSALQHEAHRFGLFEASERPARTRSSTVALSIIPDCLALRCQGALVFSPLPHIPRGSLAAEVMEFAKAPEKDPYEQDDDYELPPSSQPVLMDDGIIWANTYSPKMCDAHFNDDGDHKNLPDYDRYQDGEVDFYSDDIENAWIKADREECSRGARLRLYKALDGLKNECGYACDPEPLTTSSSLSPFLVIYQIPDRIPPSFNAISDEITPKTEHDFAQMFRRYACMTSYEGYRRVSAFTQDDPMFPRWLLIQEFWESHGPEHWLRLKKQEAEYWWRKNGWDGVLVEHFRAVDMKKPNCSE